MRLALAAAVLLLTACAAPTKPPSPAAYDLGMADVAWRPAGLPLRGVGVFAPSWLAGTAMHYRLLYADGLRREAYVESRWAAPPGELIERALSRQTPAQGGGCRLRLDLDELAQVFDAPQASRVVLEARASLVAPRRDAVLVRQAFAVAAPAAGADARGGAAAAAAAVRTLGGELGAWLARVAGENPTLAERCRQE